MSRSLHVECLSWAHSFRGTGIHLAAPEQAGVSHTVACLCCPVCVQRGEGCEGARGGALDQRPPCGRYRSGHAGSQRWQGPAGSSKGPFPCDRV